MKTREQRPGVAWGSTSHKAGLGLMVLSLGLTAGGFGLPFAKAAAKGKAATEKKSWFQIGKASWYGAHFHGHKTATGEKFDPNGLTCAHRSLPLGSWVRVTNLLNKKIAFLRVNDRGPVSGGLIVDLSYGAAQRLGISGLGKVRIEQVRADDPTMAAARTEGTSRPFYMEVASNTDGVPLLPAVVAER